MANPHPMAGVQVNLNYPATIRVRHWTQNIRVLLWKYSYVDRQVTMFSPQLDAWEKKWGISGNNRLICISYMHDLNKLHQKANQTTTLVWKVPLMVEVSPICQYAVPNPDKRPGQPAEVNQVECLRLELPRIQAAKTNTQLYVLGTFVNYAYDHITTMQNEQRDETCHMGSFLIVYDRNAPQTVQSLVIYEPHSVKRYARARTYSLPPFASELARLLGVSSLYRIYGGQTGTGSCFSHSLAFVASCINYNKMPAGGRGFPNLPNDACEIWTTGAVNTQIALAPGTQHM